MPDYKKSILTIHLRRFLFVTCIFAVGLNIQAQSYVWAKSLVGYGTSSIDNLEPGMSIANDVAIDSEQNVIITGYSTDSVDFDPGVNQLILFTPDQNPYLAKYDANGNLLWAHVFPSGWIASGNSVTVDQNDNVIFAGNAFMPTDFDPGPNEFILGESNQNGGFAFFAKFDPNGNFVFAKEFYGSFAAIPNRVRCDGNGNILIGGRFYGDIDIDPGPDEYILNGQNGGGFWAKFDPEGNLIYGKSISGISNIGDLRDLWICENGDVLISGYFGSLVDFDPGVDEFLMQAAGASDRFFARYTSEGDFIWAKRLNLNSSGCCSPSEHICIRENSEGDILIAGNFKQTADFDPGPGKTYLFGGLTTSSYFAKFNSQGSFIWAKSIKGGFCPVYDMEIDCRDNIYLTGSLVSADFDPTSAIANLQSNVASASTHYMAVYDTDGNFIRVKQIGGSRSGPLIVSMAISNEQQYMAGGFRYTVDFDPDEGEALLTMDGIGWNTYFAKYKLEIEPIQTDTTLCDQSELKLDVSTSNASYLWDTGATTSTLEIDQSGDYNVVIWQDDCTIYRNFTVDFDSLPRLAIDSLVKLCDNKELDIRLNPAGYNVLWSDNSTDSIRTINSPGIYWVQFYDSLCSRIDTFELEFLDCEVVLIMPNVFTPNGDGMNETFGALQMKGIIRAKLIVFNRWGNQVFESSNLSQGWDGIIAGQPATESVYYWVVQYDTILNEAHSQSGTVNLFKE